MPRILDPVEPRGPAQIVELPRPRSVQPAAVGLPAFGAAISDAGNMLLNYAVEQERSTERTRIATEAETRWGELRNEVESAGTAAEARALWMERAPKVGKELERFANERGLPEAVPDLQLLAANHDTAVQGHLARRAGAEGVDAVRAYAAAKLEAYVNAPTEAEAQRVKTDLHRELQRVAQTNPLFTPGDADTIFGATLSEGSRRRLNTLVSKAASSQDIEGLRSLQAAIGSKSAFPDLPADMRAQAQETIGNAIDQVEAERRAEAHRAGAIAASNIAIGIIDAHDPGTLAGLRQEAEKLFQSGMIPPDTRVSLISRAETKRQALLEIAVETADIMERLNSGFGLNSQKEADVAYNIEAQTVPPERSLEHLIDFTVRAGVPPSQGANLLARAERMDQPEQLATAAEFVRRLQDRAPAAAGRVSVGPRVEAAVATAKVLGMAEQEAAKLVIDQTPDAQLLERRAEAFDTEFEDFDPLTFLQDHDIAPEFWFAADTEVHDRLLIETEETMRRVWQMTGNREVAEEAAADALRRRFSVTQVGGRMRLTDTPPERFGQMAFQGNLDAETVARAVEADVQQQLAAAGIKLPEPPEALADQPAFELRADDRTHREIKAGLKPTWELWVRGDEFGNYRRIPNPNAQPGDDPYVRYEMPTYEQLKALPPVTERIRESFREAVEGQVEGAERDVAAIERRLRVLRAAQGVAPEVDKFIADAERELKEARRREAETRTRLGP